MMKTIVLSTALLASTSLSAFAQGCNSEHYAQPMAVQDQVAAVADDSQVLTTGQISVAGVDCTATPNAAECLKASVPTTN